MGSKQIIEALQKASFHSLQYPLMQLKTLDEKDITIQALNEELAAQRQPQSLTPAMPPNVNTAIEVPPVSPPVSPPILSPASPPIFPPSSPPIMSPPLISPASPTFGTDSQPTRPTKRRKRAWIS